MQRNIRVKSVGNKIIRPTIGLLENRPGSLPHKTWWALIGLSNSFQQGENCYVQVFGNLGED